MDPQTIKVIALTTIICSTIIVVLVVKAVFQYRMRRDATPHQASPAISDERLRRIEQAVDAVAVEVERIAEAQRFTAKLLAERAKEREEHR